MLCVLQRMHMAYSRRKHMAYLSLIQRVSFLVDLGLLMSKGTLQHVQALSGRKGWS